MGSFPGATSAKRVALDVRLEEEIDRGTYVIRRITYQSEPGSRTPAFLCIPKAALAGNTTTSASARPFPAVLCLHPTDQTAGAGVVVGLGGKPNRQYASELATRGYVTIVGRSKDLIISGGYNVYPAEIEGYINDMPGVAESALVGVPHPDFGEVGVAVVVAKPGTRLEGDALIASLKSQLANFKIPKRCFVVDDLPRNTMGKVQKNLLRDQYKALFA
jgi:hypothetical protein